MNSAVLSLIAIAAILIYTMAMQQIPDRVFGDPIGPRAFPNLLVGLMGLAVLLLLIEARQWLGETLRSGWRGRIAVGFMDSSVLAVPLMLAGIGLYFLLFDLIGYIFATALFLMTSTLVIHSGSRRSALLVSAIFPVASYLLFTLVFDVPLPPGPFGE